MATILVTGCLGFIGSHFVKYILKNFHYNIIGFSRNSDQKNLHRLDDIYEQTENGEIYENDRFNLIYGDLSDNNSISGITEDVDYIVNFAAKTFVDHSIRDAKPFIQSNIVGTYNLLEEARRSLPYNKLKRFIQVSTDEVYGAILEGAYNEDSKLNPTNPYCLPPDAKILLENGREMNIEDIKDDTVILSLEQKVFQETFFNNCLFLSHNNKLISKLPINLTKKQYKDKIIEIKTEHGKIKCTPEHRILIKRPKRYSGRLDHNQKFDNLHVMEISASEIKKGDWLICARKVNYNGKETYGKDFWRFTGYFTGDGNIGKSGKYAGEYGNYIHLADEDKELLSKYDEIIQRMTFDKHLYEKYSEVNKIIKSNEKISDKFISNYSNNHGLNYYRVRHWFKGERKPIFNAVPSYYKHNTKNCWYLSFGHKKTIELLCSLGLNVHANEKTVPEILFDSTDEEISEFIAGYFDADGTIDEHTISFGSSSLILLEEVKCLLRRFGIISTINKYVPKDNEEYKSNEFYRLIISDNSSKQLFKDNINIFKDPEKITIGDSQENMYHENIYYSTVLEINDIEFKDNIVYDMEVPDTHNFISNGFVVHNSATKAGADMLCISYFNTYNLPIIITRTENNFGEYQHYQKAMPKFIKYAIDNRKLPVYGDGEHRRMWLYVEDHCSAIHHLLTHSKAGEIYHVAGEQELTNNQLAKKILSVLEKPDDMIEYIDDFDIRPGHDRRYALNTKKLKNTGWEPKYKLNESLENVINWHKDNQWWLR